jgi:hypothetical protein
MEATRESVGTTNLPNDTTTNKGGDAAPITEQAATAVLQTTSKAQASAGRLADRAREQIIKLLNNQKDRATDTLESTVNALRQCGQQLEDQGQAPVAGLANRAADGVEQVWLYLSDRDVVALEREGERFVRTQPAIFLASAFTLGFFGARFFKSGRPAAQNGQNYPVPLSQTPQSQPIYTPPAAATPGYTPPAETPGYTQPVATPGYYAGSSQATAPADATATTTPYEEPSTTPANTASTW